MADNMDQVMSYDIRGHPRFEALPSSGRPPASAAALGAGGDPVHGNMQALAGAGGDTLQTVQARGPPATFHPERGPRSVTPRRGALAAILRGGSSPPERRNALSLRLASLRGQPSDSEQFWMQCTEDALRVQKQRFEEVAACYMQETRLAFESESAAWRQALLVEEQQIAAHGRQEAQAEQDLVRSQMMESFRQYAMQQSSQFEKAAQAERQYLANAARAEVQSSRQELVLAQAQFRETSLQQSAQVNSL